MPKFLGHGSYTKAGLKGLRELGSGHGERLTIKGRELGSGHGERLTIKDVC